MEGFSDMDSQDDEGSMMSLGSDEDDTQGEEDDMMAEGEDEGDENDLDGSMGSDEDDDLAQFWTEGEDEETEDEELKRNTEQNARLPDKNSATETPTVLPSPAPAALASSTGRYVPPSLRRLQQQAAAESSTTGETTTLPAKSTEQQPKSEQQIKLERKTQGLLNKLSEANIESIIAEVEGLYREWSRNG